MEDVMTVAAYIADRYRREYDQNIDEMKMHKLMYFAQRESYIESGNPLFRAVFYGWKFGPVLREVRTAFKTDSLWTCLPREIDSDDDKKIVDRAFDEFAGKSSWNLSMYTHAEESWKKARGNASDYDDVDNPMSDDDIKQDAQRIIKRMEMRKRLGLTGEDA